MHTHTEQNFRLALFSSNSLFRLYRPNFYDVTNTLNQTPLATGILFLSQVEHTVLISPKFSQTKLSFFFPILPDFFFFLQIIPHINYPTN